MSEHPRLLALLMTVLAVSSAFLIVPLMTAEDSDAASAGIWDGSGITESSQDNPFSGIYTTVSTESGFEGTTVALTGEEYLLVGSHVTILGCNETVKPPTSRPYSFVVKYTDVTSGFGLNLDSSGNTSISGVVSKTGDITITSQTTSNNSTRTNTCVIHVVANEYSISFDSQGGTVPSKQTVSKGTSISLPSTSKHGYVFDGWYTAASGGTRVGGAGDSYIPSGDMTLYAHWRIMAINITSSAPTGSIVQYGNFAYTVTTDVSGCTISVSGADWISVSGNKLIGTPDQTGDYHITVTASKAGYESDTQSFTVKVISSLGFDTVPTAGMIVYEI